MVHFAEQRAAPYSMKSSFHKRYTVNNNLNATNNVLAAVVESGLDIHLVHLGTMGVYGYGAAGHARFPRGTCGSRWTRRTAQTLHQEILYPANPGSIYHMTKTQDQLMFAFYNKNDGLRITDLHQGIVWGTQTEETKLDERLINRFDYDGDYGTVLNRFLMQAASQLSADRARHWRPDPRFHQHPGHGALHRARHAEPAATGRTSEHSEPDDGGASGPRSRENGLEDDGRAGGLCRRIRVTKHAENDLHVENSRLLGLGLAPITLEAGLLSEITEIARKYAHRCDKSRIPCTSKWRPEAEILPMRAARA